MDLSNLDVLTSIPDDFYTWDELDEGAERVQYELLVYNENLQGQILKVFLSASEQPGFLNVMKIILSVPAAAELEEEDEELPTMRPVSMPKQGSFQKLWAWGKDDPEEPIANETVSQRMDMLGM